MRRAAFTVDVDRDVNEPRVGQVEGCTRQCPVPRFTSTSKGLELLVDLLDELSIRSTFFLEGEVVERWNGDRDLQGLLAGHEVASHAHAHEDLTGASTGIALSADWLDAIVGRSLATIEDALGRRPVGFRAPYQHLNDEVARVLARRGLLYDSTLFADVASGPRSYRLPGGLLEVPLAQGRDRNDKKVQSYLWPLHEHRRTPADYLQLLTPSDEGILVLADHSWHVVESLSGPRTAEQAAQEIEQVRRVLQGLLDQGLEFMTLETYVRSEVEG